MTPGANDDMNRFRPANRRAPCGPKSGTLQSPPAPRCQFQGNSAARTVSFQPVLQAQSGLCQLVRPKIFPSHGAMPVSSSIASPLSDSAPSKNPWRTLICAKGACSPRLHTRAQQMFARVEIDIKTLERPIFRVAAFGAAPGEFAVQIKFVALVGGNVKAKLAALRERKRQFVGGDKGNLRFKGNSAHGPHAALHPIVGARVVERLASKKNSFNGHRAKCLLYTAWRAREILERRRISRWHHRWIERSNKSGRFATKNETAQLTHQFQDLHSCARFER